MEIDSDLLDLIYAMPFDVTLWTMILERLCGLTDSMGAVLQSPALVNPDGSFALFTSYNLDLVRLHEGAARYGEHDPFSGPMLASLNGDFSRVSHAFGAVPDRSVLRGNPFWKKHMRALGIGDFMALCLYEPKDQAFPVLTLARPRNAGAYSDAALQTFQGFAFHLRFATRLLFAVQSQEKASPDVRAVLDNLPVPCALIGPLGYAAYVNPAMNRLVGRRMPLQLVGGRLTARAKAADERLQAVIAAAIRGTDGIQRPTDIALSDDYDNHLLVVISSISGNSRNILDLYSPSAVVFALGESPPVQVHEQLGRLKAVLKLSEQEALVAKDLLAGLMPEDIATLHGKSPLTVRTQIRSLLRKNNLRRVVDLQAMRRLFYGIDAL